MSPRAGDGIPTGRTARTAAVAGFVARAAGGLGANRLRHPSRPLDDDALVRTAEQAAEFMGRMKGAVMKIGQMLSFADTGLPDEARQAMAALRDDAPPMPFDVVQRILTEDLGRPPEDVFERVSPRPIAAASIGQVHAATLADGTEVAVKVQYPGAADAIRADLDNADLIAAVVRMATSLVRSLAPELDPRAIADELRDRIGEELDYRTELRNQTAFADVYRGHPFIHVPEVFPDLSTARVLTMELIDGRGWEAAVASAPDLRNRWAEVVDRFVFGSLYHYGLFNGDPHPGNYLFHEDGTVTFLDFGCVKRFSPDEVDHIGGMGRAVVDGDAPALREHTVALGYLRPGSEMADDDLMRWCRMAYLPIVADQPFAYGKAFAEDVFRQSFDLTSEWSRQSRQFALPAGQLMLQRITLGVHSILAGLEATNDWRAIVEEIWGGPPATELGRLDAAWRDARAESSA